MCKSVGISYCNINRQTRVKAEQRIENVSRNINAAFRDKERHRLVHIIAQQMYE